MNAPNSAHEFEPQRSPKKREPVFNLPSVIVAMAAVLLGIHAITEWLLNQDQNFQLRLTFAFIPAYFSYPVDQIPVPAARFWNVVSYALLHGNLMHVGINVLWMLAFGTVVARRFGSSLFLIFCVITAIAGALAHLAVNWGSPGLLIGFSAVDSGLMGAACRFMFTPSWPGAQPHEKQGLGLLASLSNRSVLGFAGFWLVLNFVIGSGLVPVFGDVSIAWEAHMGGFFAGFFLLPLFDRLLPRRSSLP
ncbi:MAG: rhomboid family intramembrane serine protease [Pseudomonadota bacterium]